MHRLLIAVLLVLLLSGIILSSDPTGVGSIAPFTERAPALPAAPDSLQTDVRAYHWPTDAGRIVTSTFGEYRRTHFHGGIDISSGDITGYRVTAARAGYVARIRISPVGYGKMLYIRHPDGYTTTYAHLRNFAPAIDARASAVQHALGHYPVDITCTPGEFPVRAGELIAYSGDTGTGSPHLHFEIRDPLGDPINPLLCPAFRISDDIPPTIRAIAVSPLSPEATVDGQPQTQTYRPVSSSAHRGSLSPPIVVVGQIGFSVDVRDRIPRSRFRNGVYAYSLSIDGKPQYAVRLDRAPAKEAHEIRLVYDEELLDEGRGRFAKLYMDSPNHLPFYTPPDVPSGIIDDVHLTPGPHAFRIVCADFAGNEDVVEGTVIVSRIPSVSAEAEGNDVGIRLLDPDQVRTVIVATRGTAGEWSRRAWPPPAAGFPRAFSLPLPPGARDIVSVSAVNRWGTVSPPRILVAANTAGRPAGLTLQCTPGEEFVQVRVRTDGVFASPPTVVVHEGNHRSTVLMSAVDIDQFAGWFRPREDYRGIRHVSAEASVNGHPSSATAEISLYPIVPGTAGSFAIDQGRLTIEYDSLSVLKPLFLQYERVEDTEGARYVLGPSRSVLGDGITVTLLADSSHAHTALFHRTHGNWELIGTPSEGWQAARTGRVERSLGEVMLLADDTPPVIAFLRITNGGWRKPKIAFRFGDNLSGIEYDDLNMYIDNVTVIPEVDGEHHRAVYQVTEPLGHGSHHLSIRLKDRMGNLTVTERQFDVR